MTDAILFGAAAGFVVLTLWAAVSDIATMTIPNRIPALLVLAFAPAAVAGPLGLADIGWQVAGAAAVFAVTVGLFAVGAFGGGDAKLMPALALWMSPAALVDFVFHTALAGGVLGLAFLLLRRLPLPAGLAERTFVARLMTPQGGIPYGVAIAWGALAAAPRTPLLAVLAG